LKSKDDNKRIKKALPLKVGEVFKLPTICCEMIFCEDARKSSGKNEKAVKFFYSENSLFIGARGGAVSRTHLD
jgi:hypothetical protein